VLPLTAEVGVAMADYLRMGRPDTLARQVFVQCRIRPGEPISASVVARAVDHALRRAGMDAPARGANLLRHSLATGLLAGGASMRQIAELMGHSSLATTRISARGGRHRGAARGRAAVAGAGTMSTAMAALAGEFIAMRRSPGYRSPSQERAVRSLARHLDQAGIGAPVPLQASLDWAASTTSADPRNPARRLAVARVFLRHLAGLDGATEVPPPGLLGPALRRTPPHVYSGDEIAGLLDAAAGLAPAQCGEVADLRGGGWAALPGSGSAHSRDPHPGTVRGG
jgi:hypothetical protein